MKGAGPWASCLTSPSTDFLMEGLVSLFWEDSMESTKQNPAHGIEAIVHSVNTYWASTTRRLCSATKKRSKSPLLIFRWHHQDLARVLKTHANETKWVWANLANAMIFTSPRELHQELHFFFKDCIFKGELACSRESWAPRGGKRQCGYGVSQAVHLGNQTVDNWSNPHPGLQDLGRNRSQ